MANVCAQNCITLFAPRKTIFRWMRKNKSICFVPYRKSASACAHRYKPDLPYANRWLVGCLAAAFTHWTVSECDRCNFWSAGVECARIQRCEACLPRFAVSKLHKSNVINVPRSLLRATTRREPDACDISPQNVHMHDAGKMRKTFRRWRCCQSACCCFSSFRMTSCDFKNAKSIEDDFCLVWTQGEKKIYVFSFLCRQSTCLCIQIGEHIDSTENLCNPWTLKCSANTHKLRTQTHRSAAVVKSGMEINEWVEWAMSMSVSDASFNQQAN